MSVWGNKYLPVTEGPSIRAQLLEEGGPKLWAEFMYSVAAHVPRTDYAPPERQGQASS